MNSKLKVASAVGAVLAIAVAGIWFLTHSSKDSVEKKSAVRVTRTSVAGPANLQLRYNEFAAVLKWQVVSGAMGYNIYASPGTQIDPNAAPVAQTDKNTIDVTGIVKGKPYVFAVTARVGETETQFSDVALGVFGPPLLATQIALGAHHACAVDTGGAVTCWGANEAGQLGDGHPSTRGIGVHVREITARAVSAGDKFSCAILSDGSVTCWGSNDHGELNMGDKPGSYGLTPVKLPAKAISIYSSGTHTCAILEDYSAKCWGDGHTVLPRPAIPNNKAIAQSRSLSCALTNHGDFKCWSPQRLKPIDVLPEAHQVESNSDAVCALIKDHKIECWDAIEKGRIRKVNNALVNHFREQTNVMRISMNDRMACVTFDYGGVACWGSNLDWELGTEGVDKSDTPVATVMVKPSLQGQVYLGGDFVCAQNASSEIFCRGSNQFGQLGNGFGFKSAESYMVLR